MFQRIARILGDTGALLSAEANLFLRRLVRILGSGAVMVGAALVGALACLGLLGALVVWLAPEIGVAGALASVCGTTLLVCALVGATSYRRVRRAGTAASGPTDEIDLQLESKRDEAMNRLSPPAPVVAALPSPDDKPGPTRASLDAESKPLIDPLLAIAAVSAAVAVLGPSRLIRLGGMVIGGVKVARAAATGLQVIDLVQQVSSAVRGAKPAAASSRDELEGRST